MGRMYTLTIDESLTKGLRQEEKQPINSGLLAECYNVRVSERGLVPREACWNPFASAQRPTISHPFPQLFQGKYASWLAGSTGIWQVDKSDPDGWSLLEFASLGGSTSYPWHFADMGYTVLFTNPEYSVVRSSKDSLTGGSDTADVFSASSAFTPPSCACAEAGRLFLGGFGTGLGSDWQQIWSHWASLTGQSWSPQMTNNYVMWSSLGRADALLYFYPELSETGVLGDRSDESSLAMTLLERNQWGFAPMPWEGVVWALYPLAENVICYGEDGVALLYNRGVEMVGVNRLTTVPCYSRTSMGVGKLDHLMLDASGELHLIQADGQVRRLGYREFFADSVAAGSTIVMAYNEQQQEYLISDGTSGWLLTRSGLSTIQERLTSGFHADGRMQALFSRASDKRPEFTTGTLVPGGRGFKSIERVQLYGEHNAGPFSDAFSEAFDVEGTTEVQIDYRTDFGGAWHSSPWFYVNPEGIAWTRCGGHEFRLRVRCGASLNFMISRIDIIYTYPDGRQ